MTKSISCADVGAECGWSTTAETEEEILQKCAEHAKDTHNMSEIPDEIEFVKQNSPMMVKSVDALRGWVDFIKQP